MFMQEFGYGFDDGIFSSSQRIDFHGFKDGEHKFRVLPPFAPGKLFHQVDLHWGFTDENGKKKALKCTKYTHKVCPICDEVDRLKGEVEMLKMKIPESPQQQEETKSLIEVKEARIGEIRRKPTYLWNIILEDGAQKVLQLSWNAHDPLLSKVKFYWEQKKINVTDVNNNYGLWCLRTGKAAKTRYVYEVLEQTVRKLENLKPLIDLTKVYKDSTVDELRAIVEQGFVGLPSEDPNDRDFTAQMPSGLGNESQTQSQQNNTTQATSTQTTQTTPQNTNVSSPSGESQVQTPPPSPSNNQLSNEAKQTAEAEAERLMAMLRGN
jgi:hypothetical protein